MDTDIAAITHCHTHIRWRQQAVMLRYHITRHCHTPLRYESHARAIGHLREGRDAIAGASSFRSTLYAATTMLLFATLNY